MNHLKRLESEGIHTLRGVVAEWERHLMLCSVRKDSVILLVLAPKAFHPGRPPSPARNEGERWDVRGLHLSLGHPGFDSAVGGARRDEEKARAKGRVSSLRGALHQSTRIMAAGASMADVAVVLVDAGKGSLNQHACPAVLVSLLGVIVVVAGHHMPSNTARQPIDSVVNVTIVSKRSPHSLQEVGAVGHVSYTPESER